MNKRKNIALDVINVSKSFGSTTILKSISFEAVRGETVVLLGKSGTGKSVILQCIVGLLTPDSGDIFILGQNIPQLDYDALQEIRKKIGFLFQSGALYDSMSVRDNLEFPLRRHEILTEKEIEDRVKQCLDDVGLLSSIDKMPSELSGGMRKRVGLARTIILKPEVILYDEPTTGLDPATSREISRLIIKMQEKLKVSSLIVTHDMECVKMTANKVLVLKDGTICASGAYAEISESQDEFVKSFFE
ncbi:MAG: ABC transporter ATP-binding protein [Ignavibacteriae bacterium]|nr:ABC transporter ATP-binding protein [Ignavibacteriota bacterium]